MTAYVNVHGQPIGVSARDAVIALKPNAICIHAGGRAQPLWKVLTSNHHSAGLMGTGANEEAAWRDAWSRMLADDITAEGQA